MTKEDIVRLAKEADVWVVEQEPYQTQLERFAILVAKQQKEEDAKLVENMTLEWPDQPEFAQVERTTIQDCAKIIRQRVVTYD